MTSIINKQREQRTAPPTKRVFHEDFTLRPQRLREAKSFPPKTPSPIKANQNQSSLIKPPKNGKNRNRNTFNNARPGGNATRKAIKLVAKAPFPKTPAPAGFSSTRNNAE
jgi:hypothetical protein